MSKIPDDLAAAEAIAPESPLEGPLVVAPAEAFGELTLASWPGARLAIAMFLCHFSGGCWIVTLGSYVGANSGVNGLGIFAAGFIGMAYAAGPLGGLVSPFLTGVLADQMFAAERLTAGLSLGCAMALAWAASTHDQTAFFWALVLYFLCYYPSFSLVTSMAMHHFAKPERDFPLARACGTLGWIAGGVFVGWVWPRVTGQFIEDKATPMVIGLVAQLLTAAFCLTLPHTPPPNRRATRGEASAENRGEAWRLLRSPRFAGLMALAVLAHIPSQFYYAYSNIFLNWAGMTAAAAKLTLGQLVEVACMLVLPAILLRSSVKAAVAVGMAAWVARFLMLAAASSESAFSGPLLYGAILLHGVAFTLVTISLQLEVDRCAGRRRRATAQGMFTVAVQGLGCFVGAQLAGQVGARLLPVEVQHGTPQGWRTFWLFAAAGAAVALALSLFLMRGGDRREVETA